MQDAIAIAVAIAAGLWLVRTLWRQLAAPSCGKADSPPGSDGFVPLERLTAGGDDRGPRQPPQR